MRFFHLGLLLLCFCASFSSAYGQTARQNAIHSVDILIQDSVDRSQLVERFFRSLAQRETPAPSNMRPLKMTIIFSSPQPPTPNRYLAHLFLHDSATNQQQQSVQISGLGADPGPILNYLQKLSLDGRPMQVIRGATQRQSLSPAQQTASPQQPHSGNLQTSPQQVPATQYSPNLQKPQTGPEINSTVLAQQALSAMRLLQQAKNLNSQTERNLSHLQSQTFRPSPSAPPSAKKHYGSPGPRVKGAYVIQLGAYRQKKLAQQRLALLKTRLPRILGTHPLILKSLIIPNRGRFYRLYAAQYATEKAAQKACRRLKSNGYDCFARKG